MRGRRRIERIPTAVAGMARQVDGRYERATKSAYVVLVMRTDFFVNKKMEQTAVKMPIRSVWTFVYGKTESGKTWRKKPIEETRETVPPVFYENFVRSISFFNGFMGGTCRAEYNYTGVGYLPTKITTISPDRAEKHIDYFTFDYIGG